MQAKVIHRSSLSPIGATYRYKLLNPIGSSYRNSSKKRWLVDKMLEDCSDLIDPNYKKWFAVRFYTLSQEDIHRAASEARQDALQSPQRLFAHIVNRIVKQRRITSDKDSTI